MHGNYVPPRFGGSFPTMYGLNLKLPTLPTVPLSRIRARTQSRSIGTAFHEGLRSTSFLLFHECASDGFWVYI